MNIRTLAAAALIALPTLTAIPASAADSIDAIEANQAQFDGVTVTVTGTVKGDIKQRTSRKTGKDYETFTLCQTQCLTVYSQGHPAVTVGLVVTVTGDYTATKTIGSFVVKNEIYADDGGITTTVPAAPAVTPTP
jgi:hypothetical protein